LGTPSNFALTVLSLLLHQLFYYAGPAIAAESSESDLFVIPECTKIQIVLDDTIDSRGLRTRQVRDYAKDYIWPEAKDPPSVAQVGNFSRSHLIDAPGSILAPPGEQIRAHTTENIVVDGKICIPAKSLIYGFVTSFPHSKRVYALGFDRLPLPNGKMMTISAIPRARGQILHVHRSGADLLFQASQACVETIDASQQPCVQKNQVKWVALMIGHGNKSPDLQEGDEITLETMP
jgi:hypothetical protein